MKENKTCSKCGEEKLATAEYFYRNKCRKDGFGTYCKICKAAIDKQYNKDNSEAMANQTKQYRQANREARAEYDKQYRQANREAIAEYNRQYHQARKAKQAACVYQIVNNQNGRIYIGETMRGELRWKEHLTSLKGGYHPNADLQADFNNFGEEAFEWRIIKELPKDREILAKEEKLHIDKMIAEGKSLYNERLIT
jgi:hypothetical protein